MFLVLKYLLINPDGIYFRYVALEYFHDQVIVRYADYLSLSPGQVNQINNPPGGLGTGPGRNLRTVTYRTLLGPKLLLYRSTVPHSTAFSIGLRDRFVP